MYKVIKTSNQEELEKLVTELSLEGYQTKGELMIEPNEFGHTYFQLMTKSQEPSENINEERSGDEIFKELEALKKLYEVHKVDFSKITIREAIAVNASIRKIIKDSLKQTDNTIGFKNK